ALQEAGDMPAARASFERTIALAPGMPGAYFNWANSAKVGPQDPALAAMADLGARSDGLPVKELAVLNFALGKAHEDIGRYDEAFAYLAEGNRLKRSLVSYDEADVRRNFDRLRASFTPGLLAGK